MSSSQLDGAEAPGTTPARLRTQRGRRPFGLYIILILLTLQGVIGVLATSLFGLVLVMLPSEIWSEHDLQLFGIAGPLALLLVTLVVVIGLWRYQAWGWYGMMLLLAYWMASDAIGYFTGNPVYGSMLLNVAMVFYLNQREVRELFDAPVTGEVSA